MVWLRFNINNWVEIANQLNILTLSYPIQIHIHILMGNTIQSTGLLIDSRQWGLMCQSSNLMINLQTAHTAVFKSYPNISKQLLKSYELRTKNNQYLVNVIGLMSKNMSFYSCYNDGQNSASNSKQNNILVLVENIQFRLPDLGALQYFDALYILKQCFEGIKIIVHQYGSQLLNIIELQQQMIGINEQGQCKIWLNQNYFQNIQFEEKIKNPEECLASSTSKFIQRLFNIIESRMIGSIQLFQRYQYYRIKNQLMENNGIFTYSLADAEKFINTISKSVNLQNHRIVLPTSQINKSLQKISDLKKMIDKNKEESTKGHSQKQRKNKISLKLFKTQILAKNISTRDKKQKISEPKTLSTSAGKRRDQISQKCQMDKKEKKKWKNYTYIKQKRWLSPLKNSRTTVQSEYSGIKLGIKNRESMGVCIRKKVY